MDTRRSALETQGKLKVDLEQSTRELALLQASHETLVQQEQAVELLVGETRAAISELEKGKRSMESELQSLCSRAFDSESFNSGLHLIWSSSNKIARHQLKSVISL